MQKRTKRSSHGMSVQLRSSNGFHSRLELCAAEAELQQPMAGPEEPGGGAGRAATPRSPSACEPAGARGGRGLAPHDSAATAATATAARTQEAARSGAGAGHIPRRRQRRPDPGRASRTACLTAETRTSVFWVPLAATWALTSDVQLDLRGGASDDPQAHLECLRPTRRAR